MGGRGGSFKSGGGVNASFSRYGLTEEDYIPDGMFDFYDSRFGRYAADIAEEIEIAYDPDEDSLVSVTNGKNKAFAMITDADADEDTDILVGLASTGGGTGTRLLAGVMERSKDRGKDLMWKTENATSEEYYDALGLGKYASGRRGSKTYDIPASELESALSSVRRKIK